MIEISSLKLNKECTKLIISSEETSGGYITSISIDTQKTFVCTSEPSEHAINITLDIDSSSVVKDSSNHIIKLVDYEIDLTSTSMLTIDIKNDILFVFVAGVVISDEDSIPVYVTGVIFDQNIFYNSIFKRMHSYIIHGDCCTLSSDAETLALLYEAFQLSWFTADPRKFIYYWNQLHSNKISIKNCNCNG